MTDLILFAMVGASNLKGEACGFMSHGMCIPLAATENARTVIEEVGEDAVAAWFADDEVVSPKAGGLWVAEVEIASDQDIRPELRGGYGIDACTWRPPTTEELEGLIARQMMRARRTVVVPVIPGSKSWVFKGALV